MLAKVDGREPVAVSASGEVAVVTREDGSLGVWRLDPDAPPSEVAVISEPATTLALSDDGSSLVSATDDGQVTVRELPAMTVGATWSGEVPLRVSPDGEFVICSLAREDDPRWRAIVVRSRATGEQIAEVEGGPPFAVSRNGKLLFSTAGGREAQLMDLPTGAVELAFRTHGGALRALGMTPDGTRGVSASSDGAVRVWDLTRRSSRRLTRAHRGRVAELVSTSTGAEILSRSTDGSVFAWDAEGRRQGPALLEGARAITVTSSGTRALVASDSELRICQIEPTRLADTRAVLIGKVRSIDSSEGPIALAGGSEGVIAWNGETGERVAELPGRPPLALSPDASTALVVSPDDEGVVDVWDLERREKRFQLGGHTEEVVAILISPDGKRAITAAGGWFDSFDALLRVWCLETGRRLMELDNFAQENVGSLQFTKVAATPDWSLVTTGYGATFLSSENPIAVWELARAERRGFLTGCRGEVIDLTVSSTDTLAASISQDQTVRVWDLLECRCLSSLTFDNALTACTFSPDGSAVVVGDELGNVSRLRIEGIEGWRGRQKAGAA